MWAHYSSNHSGFCLAFDTEKFDLDRRFGVDFYDVLYSESRPKINFHDDTYKDFAAVKDISWSYEREVRLQVTNDSLTNGSFQKDGENVSGDFYHFHPKALVGIYSGVKAEFDFPEFRELIKNYHHPVKYYKGKLSKDKFSIDFDAPLFGN